MKEEGKMMKKFINNPSDLTQELLEGLALANKEIIDLVDGNLIVNKKLKDADRVTVVTLGGELDMNLHYKVCRRRYG